MRAYKYISLCCFDGGPPKGIYNYILNPDKMGKFITTPAAKALLKPIPLGPTSHIENLGDRSKIAGCKRTSGDCLLMT
jgi:hypothetical protein